MLLLVSISGSLCVLKGHSRSAYLLCLCMFVAVCLAVLWSGCLGADWRVRVSVCIWDCDYAG